MAILGKDMKQKLPDICDICAKDIDTEMQYTFEVYQGKSAWFNAQGIRIKAKQRIDCCHPCWLTICKNGYKPNFIKEQKNPNYVKGSDKEDEKYSFIIEQPDTQKPLEIPSSGAL